MSPEDLAGVAAQQDYLTGAHEIADGLAILLAFIVYWAGGGVLNLRLGHFVLNVGFT